MYHFQIEFFLCMEIFISIVISESEYWRFVNLGVWCLRIFSIEIANFLLFFQDIFIIFFSVLLISLSELKMLVFNVFCNGALPVYCHLMLCKSVICVICWIICRISVLLSSAFVTYSYFVEFLLFHHLGCLVLYLQCLRSYLFVKLCWFQVVIVFF